MHRRAERRRQRGGIVNTLMPCNPSYIVVNNDVDMFDVTDWPRNDCYSSFVTALYCSLDFIHHHKDSSDKTKISHNTKKLHTMFQIVKYSISDNTALDSLSLIHI